MKPGFQPSIRYTRPGLGEDKELVDHYKQLELRTSKWVGTLLEREFPGHAWHVQVQITAHGGQRADDGLISIRLNGLMPADRYFHVHLKDALVQIYGRRAILHAAGELLERYNIPRTGFMLDHWRAALNAMPIKARQLGRGHLAPLLD